MLSFVTVSPPAGGAPEIVPVADVPAATDPAATVADAPVLDAPVIDNASLTDTLLDALNEDGSTPEPVPGTTGEEIV